MCKSMVVTTQMFHKMNESKQTISDMDKIDLELHNKKSPEISIQNN
jgi:hypothetical protein